MAATPPAAASLAVGAPPLVDEGPTNYALRLSEALRAISAVQDPPLTEQSSVLAAPSVADSATSPPPQAPEPVDVLELLEPAVATTVRHSALADEASTNYALRLTEAPDAISSIQDPPARSSELESDELTDEGDELIVERSGQPFLARVLTGLDSLPPIRLPIGPPVPWRFALPALALLVVVMVFFGRPTSRADPQGAQLPLPTPTIQPLFANAQPTPVEAPTLEPLGVAPATPQPQAAQAPPPLGVQDPSGTTSFDILDVGLKLIAVLALAYASLLLLKRMGIGGAATFNKTGGSAKGMRVVASLLLAPNRSVHLLRVPGGKTLLVGATPNQINLIADLGEIPDDQESAAASSFFDVLKGKIPQ